MEHKHVWRMRYGTHTCGGGGMERKHLTKEGVFNINTCGGGGMKHKPLWRMRHGTYVWGRRRRGT